MGMASSFLEIAHVSAMCSKACYEQMVKRLEDVVWHVAEAQRSLHPMLLRAGEIAVRPRLSDFCFVPFCADTMARKICPSLRCGSEPCKRDIQNMAHRIERDTLF